MKKITLYISAAFLLSVSSHIATAQTGDEIITKHIEAIGGEANWSKAKSFKMVGSTNAMGMDIPMEITFLDKKAMRTDMTVMGMSGWMILTETGGWMYMPFQPGMDKVTPLPAGTGEGSLSYKNSQLADRSEIASATFAGRDTLDNVPCLKVTLKNKDNEEQTAYFDATTYYMVRLELIKKINDEDREIAISFSNFKKQPLGITVAMTQSNPMTGGDMTFTKFEVNPAIPENYFKPEEPKAEAKADTKKPAAKK